jgi:hypothetical protein
MTITISPDQEALDAVAEQTTANNAASSEAYLATVLGQHVAGLVAAKRAATVAELQAATDALDYAKRVELAQINRDFVIANS